MAAKHTSGALSTPERRRKPNAETASPKNSAVQSGAVAVSAPTKNNTVLALVAACLGVAFIWSYWPVLVDLVAAWNREPDYSHGYFVVPVAGYFLWRRRHLFPGFAATPQWAGLIFLAVAAAARVAGSFWYIDAVEAWTIPVWVAGCCWILGGWNLLRWSLPGVLFLGFMIPLPFRAETLLSYPLQRAATHLSCWLLQVFGQAAFAEGNVVVVNDMEMLVAEACSGLRIFVSIVAIAFAYVVLMQRPWWFKAFVVASVLPVTLLANSLRIAATGLLLTHVSGEAAHRFSHDLAGFAMIPLAAALFALVVFYLGRLLVESEAVSTREVLRGG